MRIVDAHSGDDVRVGDVVEGWQIANVVDRWWKVDFHLVNVADGTPHLITVPVRFMHPSFLFQRVAFLPS